jgi:hypothetical protein
MCAYRSLTIFSSATILGAYIFPALALAESPYRACNTANPPLARGEADVVPGDARFNATDGRTYGVSIFGLGKPNPEVNNKPYDICLRYEFENSSGEEIQEFRWRDAGVGHIRFLKPGVRYRIPRNAASNVQTVVDDETDLYAFENIAAKSRTVFAVKGGAAKPAGINFGSLGSSEQLAAANAAIEPIVTIEVPPEQREYQALDMGVESPEVSVSIQSSATIYPMDRFAEVGAELRVTSRMEGAVTVYAPTLLAFENADFMQEESLAQKTDTFLAYLEKSDWPLKLTDSTYVRTIRVRTPEMGGDVPALFVGEHPVTITIGDWSACLIAQIYSPVPLTFSDARCRSAAQ